MTGTEASSVIRELKKMFPGISPKRYDTYNGYAVDVKINGKPVQIHSVQEWILLSRVLF